MPDVTGGTMAGAGSLIGGIGSAATSLFGSGGNDSSDAMRQAAGMQYSASMAAVEEQRRQLEQARQYMQPYYEAGTNAIRQYGGLLNLPGYDAVDPTQTLRATPGYQWQMDQGVNALNRAGAARGLTGSGAQMKALTQYGQGLADQTYGNYLNRIMNLSNSGQNAAALQGSYGMQAAPQIGNYLTQGAQAQGMGLLGSQVARQSGYNQDMSNLWGGVGTAFGGLGLLGNNSNVRNWLNIGGGVNPEPWTPADYGMQYSGYQGNY